MIKRFVDLTPFEKTEYENQVLSIGREFLRACAVVVLDGGEATLEYWDFLAEQWHIESCEQDDEDED